MSLSAAGLPGRILLVGGLDYNVSDCADARVGEGADIEGSGGLEDAFARSRVFVQLASGSAWPGEQLAAAVGANTFELEVCTAAAKRTFKSAYARVC